MKLLLLQVGNPVTGPAAIEVLVESRTTENKSIDEFEVPLDVAFNVEPLANVCFIRVVLVGHVTRVTAERDFTHSINAEERNDGRCRIATDFVVLDQSLAAHDESL